MSDDLVKRLRDSTKWYHGDCELKMAAADCIREQRDLLEECEMALEEALEEMVYGNPNLLSLAEVRATLAKLRAAKEKTDE